MARFKKWQSGSADLVSVAVGMVILSIAASGTAASMIYGREILSREERFKTAAYMLRAEMEKKIWELNAYTAAQSLAALAEVRPHSKLLQYSGERGSGSQDIDIWFAMDRIVPVPDPVLSTKVAYWVVTAHATWEEPEMAGGLNSNNYQSRSISYKTAIPNFGY